MKFLFKRLFGYLKATAIFKKKLFPESEEKKLSSTVTKGLQIFKKYLVPQVENMERLVKKIQLLDFELQKKLLVLLEEDTGNGTKTGLLKMA